MTSGEVFPPPPSETELLQVLWVRWSANLSVILAFRSAQLVISSGGKHQSKQNSGRVSLEHFSFADFFMASHSERTPYGHLCRPGSKTCHAGLHVDPAQLLYLALHVTWWLFIWLRVCCPIVNRTGRGQGTGNWSWNWIRLIWFYLPYVNGCVHRAICERIYYSWSKCPLNSIFQPIWLKRWFTKVNFWPGKQLLSISLIVSGFLFGSRVSKVGRCRGDGGPNIFSRSREFKRQRLTRLVWQPDRMTWLRKGRAAQWNFAHAAPLIERCG